MAEIHPFPPALLALAQQGGFVPMARCGGGRGAAGDYAAEEHISTITPRKIGGSDNGMPWADPWSRPERLIAPGAWYHLAPEIHEARFPEATTMLEFWFYPAGRG